MNYGELKQNLTSKGFGETADYEEFEELGYTYTAINDALAQIAVSFPCKTYYEFELDETDTGIMYLDMSDRDGFIRFGETPILFEKDGEEIFRKFTEYEIEMDHTIVMKADDYKGSFRVYYYKEPTKVTTETDDSFVFDIPLGVHHLIPLLAAYYLWLDDDERKATMYKNDYDDARMIALSEVSRTTARALPGEWGDI